MSTIFPTIAVIVVNWNGWRDTVKAYTSLQGSSYTGWRLIIVDNASTDGSPAQLSDLGPKAHADRQPGERRLPRGLQHRYPGCTDRGRALHIPPQQRRDGTNRNIG
jgi:GT2 family glycosyltransferase